MKIVQKKASNILSFDFGEDKFDYSVTDKTGSSETTVYYGSLPNKPGLRIEQNEWLRNVSILWIVLGLFELAMQFFYREVFVGKWFWLTVGVACYAWYRYSRVKYSVFNCGDGSVYVIQGKDHDRIVSELMTRRKEQIRKVYGEIDLTNDPGREIEKFKWLLEQGILTKEEADRKIAEVEASITRVVDFPKLSLN